MLGMYIRHTMPIFICTKYYCTQWYIAVCRSMNKTKGRKWPPPPSLPRSLSHLCSVSTGREEWYEEILHSILVVYIWWHVTSNISWVYEAVYVEKERERERDSYFFLQITGNFNSAGEGRERNSRSEWGSERWDTVHVSGEFSLAQKVMQHSHLEFLFHIWILF